jgi:hypothetical protein
MGITALRAWITPAIFVRAARSAALTKIAVAYSSENGYKQNVSLFIKLFGKRLRNIQIWEYSEKQFSLINS